MLYKVIESDILNRIDKQKWTFVQVFFITTFLTYSVLYSLDFFPEPIANSVVIENTTDETIITTSSSSTETIENEEASAVKTDPLPIAIVFDSLEKTIPVLNPESREIADLDAALLEGVVRHPDSADFNDTGNIFILGHSSYLPNVFNKNFQAFNGIQDLKWGDTVRLQSKDTEYIYRVDKVYKAKATEVTVPIDVETERLTIATCNSFGSTDDRFIVEATLVEKKAL